MLPGNGERNWYFITIQEKDWKYQQQTWEWAGGNEKANGVTRSGQWSLFVLIYPLQIQQHSYLEELMTSLSESRHKISSTFLFLNTKGS